MKKKAFILIMAAALLAGYAGKAQSGTEQPAELDRKIADLAAQIAALPALARGGKIAVFPILERQDGAMYPFGMYVSRRIIARLETRGRFAVVESGLLIKLLDERRVGMPGVMDDDAARKAGKALGVVTAVTGAYACSDSRVRISVRVLSAEGGPGIATIETIISRTGEVDQLLAVKGPIERRLEQPSAQKETIKGATMVPVSLGDGSFSTVTGILPPKYRGCTVPLLDQKPAGIVREPDYRGSIRKYGTMKLGTTGKNTFLFALDITPGGYAALYFDKNQNGDLADDGPIANQGKSGTYFAGALTLPFSSIMDKVNFSEYRGWFWVDAVSWSRNRMCYFSTTQLKGEATIESMPYLVYVVDSRENDADYTNDGVYIDLNQDKRIDVKTEYVPPDGAAVINGKNYSFRISREAGSRRVLFQDPAVGPGDAAKILKVTLVHETEQCLVLDVEYYLSEKFPGRAIVGVYPDMPYWTVDATQAYPGRHTVSIKVDLHFDAKGKMKTVKSSTLRFQIDEYQDYSYKGEIFRRIVPFEKQWKRLSGNLL